MAGDLLLIVDTGQRLQWWRTKRWQCVSPTAPTHDCS